MHALIKSITTRELVTEQIPAFAISLVLAEMFFKFHSFTLEVLAFLATWYVVDLTIGFIVSRFSRK